MMTRWKAIPAIVGLVALAACTTQAPEGAGTSSTGPTGKAAGQGDRILSGPGGTQAVNVAQVRLTSFDACPDLLSYFKAEGAKQVGPWGLGGGENHLYRMADTAARAPGASGTEKSAPVQGQDFSGTNVQEAGVDESDEVKTDGRYLYIARGHRIDVVDSTGKPRLVDSVDVGDKYGANADLLLDGKRLLAMTRVFGPGKGTDLGSWPGPKKTRTQLELFDVSDPARLRSIAKLRVDGSLVSSRLIDGTARIVQQSPPADLPWRMPVPQPRRDGTGEPPSPKDQGRLDKKSLAENKRLIGQSRLDDWLPQYVLTGADGRQSRGRLVSCDQVHRPRDFSGLGMTSVLSVDLHGDLSPTGSTGVLAGSGTVYASATRLYVSTARWYDFERLPMLQRRVVADRYRTQIHAFDIGNPDRAAYLGSGQVRGHLLSQWSLSEHEGVLRVATTDGMPWTGTAERSESYVTTFAERGKALVQLGQVGGLGKGERIYAVRFIGDVGYVVTFRQVDPLYTVDLSDPAKPAVRGELKIPGYSAYLHPVGEGLLLGVGQNADTSGRVKGLQMSLFDVSDVARPRRLHTVSLKGASSSVEYSHHGFLHWPKTGLIVVPYLNESNSSQSQTSGAIGYTVDRTTGFSEVGRVSHLDEISRRDPEIGWLGQVNRSVVIGDSLYTISQIGVDKARLDSLREAGWLGLPSLTDR